MSRPKDCGHWESACLLYVFVVSLVLAVLQDLAFDVLKH